MGLENRQTASRSQYDDPVSIGIENVGGIENVSLAIEPGLNVLVGRNATNRTSLLSALGSVLGGTTASLKSDASEGAVTLAIDDTTYHRTFERANGSVITSGRPYSDRETLVDYCVVLLETNPARTALQGGEALRDVIMAPVDTVAIQSEIEQLRREQQSVESELASVREQRGRLPELRAEREAYVQQLDTINDSIEELQAEISAHEGELDATQEAVALIEDLKECTRRRASLVDELEVKQAERNALREDIELIESELASSQHDQRELTEIRERLEQLQTRQRTIDETIASLTTIVDFNEDLVNGDERLPAVHADDADIVSAITGGDEREVNCWTCGSPVSRGDIRERLDALRAVIDEKREEKSERTREIDQLRDQQDELETAATRREQHRRELERTREKVNESEQVIDDLETELQSVSARIDTLEDEVAEAEQLRDSELPEMNEEISDLQYERGQIEQRIENIDSEISDIEALPTESALSSEHERLQEQLSAARTRISDLEDEAIDAFNHHMAEVIDTLDYSNISRVWIEKKHANGSPSSQAIDTEFELYIVRETSEGVGYNDRVEHLSESEREVIGIIVALTGYLVHGVREEIPFMLLDSMEAIDAQRIAELMLYFTEHVPYLITALLPEDAAPLLDQDPHKITADMLQDV